MKLKSSHHYNVVEVHRNVFNVHRASSDAFAFLAASVFQQWTVTTYEEQLDLDQMTLDVCFDSGGLNLGYSVTRKGMSDMTPSSLILGNF